MFSVTPHLKFVFTDVVQEEPMETEAAAPVVSEQSEAVPAPPSESQPVAAEGAPAADTPAPAEPEKTE